MATVAFVYAHPDDESFGVAGTAAKLARAGHTTALLTLTRGDAGRWFGKELGSWATRDLAAERSAEWRAAVKAIGFTHARLLEWPDGGLAASPVDRATADVVQFIRDVRPDVVCTFGPEGAGSEHDDHRAASFLTLRAFHRAAVAGEFADRGTPHLAQRLYFAASPFDPEAPAGGVTPTHRVDVGDFIEVKTRAFECHRTQFKDRDAFYAMLERRGPFEYFHLAVDRAPGATLADDLL